MSRANGSYRMRDSTVSAPAYDNQYQRQYSSGNGGTQRHHSHHENSRHHSTSGEGDGGGDGQQQAKQRRMTPYERLSHDLSNDAKCIKEITLGKRIGFYRIRGELGTGNFSQVKLGIHALSKGKLLYFYFSTWISKS